MTPRTRKLASNGLEQDHDLMESRFNWTRTYKWITTLTTCLMYTLCLRNQHTADMVTDQVRSSIMLGIPAGAYGAAAEQMSSLWNIDETGFPYLSFALVSWNMGAALFPLLFVPLTENTGRMPGYFVSLISFRLICRVVAIDAL